MFCPHCGFQDQNPGRFCKRCGTNIGMVANALAGKLVNPEEVELKRQQAIEDDLLKDTLKRRRGFFAGGILTGCIGLGVMLIASITGKPEPAIAGLIPLMVGIGMNLCAWLVFKPQIPWQQQASKTSPTTLPINSTGTQMLTNYSEQAPDSVTAATTRHLEEFSPPPRVAE